MKVYNELLYKYLKPLKIKVVLLGIVLLSNIIITLILPEILGRFIDSAKDGVSVWILTKTAICFMIIVIIKQLFELSSTYLSQNIGWLATNKLRIDILNKCLSLDMNFHKKYSQGELVERIDGDISALFNFFSLLLPNFLSSIVLILGILLMIFRKGIIIGFSISIFVAYAFFIFLKIQKKAVPTWIESRTETSKFYGLLGETINSKDDIRTSGAINYFIYQYHKFLKKLYKVLLKSELMFCKMVTSSIVLFSIGSALAISISSYFWSKGIVTIGTVYVIFNYTELLKNPIDKIRFQLEDLQKSSASIKRIEEILSLQSKLLDGSNEISSDKPISIDVRNVTFKYEDRKDVLKNISFSVTGGKVVGVVGRTGSGKTTLARLIARLYDPEDGAIYFNNENITNLKIKNLRDNVAYVTQDVQIFSATLRDNVTIFNPDIDDSKIIEIINIMELDEWYKKLPDGLDTVLNSNQCGISAGEAQIIAFIRIFLIDPSIIILDEASARLDPATEKVMENALEKLLKNRTSIIIAHRLSTLNRADDIIILDHGIIIENGSRNDLVKNRDSKFYNLLNKGLEEVLQ